jgi:hypothetical protein
MEMDELMENRCLGHVQAQTYTLKVTSEKSMVNAGENYVAFCNIPGHGALDILTNVKVHWYHNSKLITSFCTLEDLTLVDKYSCEVP